MNNVVNGLGGFDPHWGMLVHSLEQEGHSVDEIEAAKAELADVIKKPSLAISAAAKALYARVLPANNKEIIKSVKKELLVFTENKIRELLTATPEQAEQAKKDLLQPDSSIQQALRLLRQLGDPSTTCWYFYETHNYYSKEERKSAVADVAHKVVQDYFNGVPTSFATMAKFLQDRKISHTKISRIVPFSDIEQSLQIIQRLADLGVKQAQDALSWSYEWNDIGNDKEKVNLQKPMESRLAGLRNLALAGHKYSQNVLAGACHHKILGHDQITDFSDQSRRAQIQELQANEVSGTFYMQVIISENKIGKLPFGLSLEERFAMLHARAAKGDKHALDSLFNAYWKNKLGDDRLALTPTERLANIEGLRAYNPSEIDIQMQEMYTENRFGSRKQSFKAKLSDDTRIQWIEDQALNRANVYAQRDLATAYARGYLRRFSSKSEVALRMPIKERMSKLKKLADLDCSEAQNILLKVAGYRACSHAEKITIEDTSEQLEALSLSDQLTQEDLLRWALGSKKDTAIHEIFMSSVDPKISKPISLLFHIRAAIKLPD
jgi:hypothetical protein